VPNLVSMAYIIERNNRFYVVAYDGADPHTGRERRRWHPAGRSPTDAEAIAERLTATRRGERDQFSGFFHSA
jgi:integrase